MDCSALTMSVIPHVNPVLARVPLEVWDFILTPLQDDRKTIQACALTCHALLFAARTHLFRTVSLTRQSAADFASFINRSPAIASCIRVLRLEADADPDFALLEHLPYATDFTLTGWVLRHTVNDALIAFLRRVEVFELRDCNMLVPELPRMLGACHELTRLSLREVYWPLNVKDGGLHTRPLRKLPDGLPAETPLHVQDLSMVACARFVYRFLARSPALVPSPCLALELPAPIEIGELLKHWGRALNHLDLTVEYMLEDGPTPCGLAANSELRSLTIKQKHDKGLHKWITEMLQSICSPHFRELKIIAPAGCQKGWQQALDALIVGDAHCHAEYLAFTIELHYPTKDPPVGLQKYVDDILASEIPNGVDFNVITVTDFKEETPTSASS